jgi:hypothetical protein
LKRKQKVFSKVRCTWTNQQIFHKIQKRIENSFYLSQKVYRIQFLNTSDKEERKKTEFDEVKVSVIQKFKTLNENGIIS